LGGREKGHNSEFKVLAESRDKREGIHGSWGGGGGTGLRSSCYLKGGVTGLHLGEKRGPWGVRGRRGRLKVGVKTKVSGGERMENNKSNNIYVFWLQKKKPFIIITGRGGKRRGRQTGGFPGGVPAIGEH